MGYQLFLTVSQLGAKLIDLHNPSRGRAYIYMGVVILIITLRRMGRKRKR